MVISRCCFVDDGKEMYQELKRKCTAIVLLAKGAKKVRKSSYCGLKKKKGFVSLSILIEVPKLLF